MGKGARNKQSGPKRSHAELLEFLEENREFLTLSAASFDGGYEAEGKRLAVTLRVLLHDTQQSHSLLKQLGVKDRINFLDTAHPPVPGAVSLSPGLAIMQMESTPTGATARYRARLDDGPPIARACVPFAGWWSNDVMTSNVKWCRRELVLKLANQEGGAHVDPSLDSRYQDLTKGNALGWVVGDGHGGGRAIDGNIAAISVRQIAHEVLETLEREKRVIGLA